jgi:tetratricopeptide (TPR) repeat protein
VDPGFSVPQEEILDLIRICQLVEGMPLGIELAAAWVKLLSCREIAAEIERCLDFLTTAMRDVPNRHHSLRAVCDHSWALLSEEEQHAFEKLSVFRGGFQRGAAERVAGASLSLLSSLVDKSLVRRTRSGRYEVHEILHQYAAEKLDQASEEEAEARDRHSAYFAAFLQHRERALKGAGQIMALAEIGADFQNVRAAWRWAIARGKVAEIRKAAPGLWLFYRMRNLFEEGERAFAQAVAGLEAKAGGGVEADIALGLALAFQGYLHLRRFWLEEEATPLLRRSLAILRQAGAEEELGLALAFAFRTGVVENVAEAEKLLHESLAINRKLGRRWEAAFCLLSFNIRAGFSWPGQVDTRPYLQESYAIFSEIGDRWRAAYSLEAQAGWLLDAGERQAAKQLYQQSLAVFREIGDGQAVQFDLDNLGYLTRELGEYEEAWQYHRESLEMASEAGHRLGVAGSLDNLGLVAYDVGDYGAAQRYFEQGLAIRREVGHAWSITISLGHLGDVALAQGDYAQARRWYQESLEVSRGSELAKEMPEALRGLGEVSTAEGDFEQARQQFRDALELEMAGQAVYIPGILKVLVAVAQLTARSGEKEKPAEWLAYVADHAVSTAQLRDRAMRLLDDLASQLPPQAMAAAREMSKGKSLDDMVGEVLQEI